MPMRNANCEALKIDTGRTANYLCFLFVKLLVRILRKRRNLNGNLIRKFFGS